MAIGLGQRVLHFGTHHPCLRSKADDEGDEGDEDDTSDEEDVGDADHPYFTTCVEGLLLVPQHGCDDVFERGGLFSSKGSSTVAGGQRT
tara:strand:+ start:1560 stop:1826 length:267 start_codon:yes stop_codon:yes gene_type:complete